MLFCLKIRCKTKAIVMEICVQIWNQLLSRCQILVDKRYYYTHLILKFVIPNDAVRIEIMV